MQGTTYYALVQPKPFKRHLRRTSLPASIMLKRPAGSKIYGVPGSTIELLKGFVATCDFLAGHLRLGGRPYHEIEQYGLPVGGVVPFPQHYTTSGGRWHLEEGYKVHERSTT